jgi:hypothetical protein
MKRPVFAMMVMVLGLVGIAIAADQLTNEEIMEKAHKAKKGYRDQLKMNVEGAAPDWAKASTMTKDWVKIAEMLGKNPPSKGPKASWTKLCEDYVKDVKAIAAAVEKKDPADFKTANTAMGKRCEDCHDKHRP